jgi:hypothetical protein
VKTREVLHEGGGLKTFLMWMEPEDRFPRRGQVIELDGVPYVVFRARWSIKPDGEMQSGQIILTLEAM